ncbi:MAG: TIGR03086 family metal-binding protein [Ilumatobacteraceae bacterium]
MSQEIIDRTTSMLQAFDARVQAAPAGSWDNPAPCEGWVARDIIVHVGSNILPLGTTLQGTDRREFAPGDDIVAAWNDARDTFTAGLTTGDLTANVPGPFGPMPAGDLIGRFVAMDLLVHTWDLARAVGGDERLDPDVVAAAYSGLKPMDAMIRQPGVFGPKTEAPEGADLQTEFLCFLGRPV